MAAVTICSDFRAQEEEICYYFHLFTFHLARSNGTGGHALSFSFPGGSDYYLDTLNDTYVIKNFIEQDRVSIATYK